MDTKKKKEIFLVLVPHSEIRAALQKKTDSLVNAGLKDVYLFPPAVPLAKLSKALNTDELKQTANKLRLTIGSEKFYLREESIIDFYQNMNLSGPRLEQEIHEKYIECFKEKIISVFNRLVIGMFLLHEKKTPSLLYNFFNDNEISSLSFRACAVANMFWQPVKKDDEIFFKWKIDKLHWLPKKSINML